MLILDACGWFLDGMPGFSTRILILLTSTLIFIFHSFPPALFILYTNHQIFKDQKKDKKIIKFITIILIFFACAAILSPFSGMLFYINENNQYTRGFAFPVFAVLQYALCAYSFILVLKNRKKIKKRVFFSLLAFPLPAIIMATFQLVYYGMVLVWPAVCIFLVASAFNIENQYARTDYLTGIGNRRSLDEELEYRIENLKPCKSFSGILMDIDGFKKINDDYGHITGDKTLEYVANALLSAVRLEDAVARMGGDEFFILTDIDNIEHLENFVDRLEKSIKNHDSISKLPCPISLSIGRFIFDRSLCKNAEDFIALLDSDMYKRKNKKRNY